MRSGVIVSATGCSSGGQPQLVDAAVLAEQVDGPDAVTRLRVFLVGDVCKDMQALESEKCARWCARIVL